MEFSNKQFNVESLYGILPVMQFINEVINRMYIFDVLLTKVDTFSQSFSSQFLFFSTFKLLVYSNHKSNRFIELVYKNGI